MTHKENPRTTSSSARANIHNHQGSILSPTDQFRAAMLDVGIEPPDAIVDSGKIERFSTNGKRGDDGGWYRFFSDGIPAGVFGDHRDGVTHKWIVDMGRDLSDEEREANRARMAKVKAERETELRKSRDQAAGLAKALLAAAVPASADHPYLTRKQVQPVGNLKQISAEALAKVLGYSPKSRGENKLQGVVLVAPVTLSDGTLATCELIDESGRKSAIVGGQKGGAYWLAQTLSDDEKVVAIGEGVATCLSANQATGYPVVAALSGGNLRAVSESFRARYPSATIIVLADLKDGKPYPDAIKAAEAVGGVLAVPAFKEGAPEWATDWNDHCVLYGLESTGAAIRAAVDGGAGGTKHTELVCVTIGELLTRELPPIDPLLMPWLGKQSLNMAYAWRGVGKTHFALNVAYAVASGGAFLGWQAPEPNGVLYLDGEMPGAALQNRLSAIIKASATECDPERFRIITPDLQSSFMPDLATQSGQAAIEEHITDSTKLIVVDNLSALARSGGKENDSESWVRIGEWAMFQRSRGRAVLFIHHAGKGGQQRGTSKREDILDSVICLSRPADYDAATEGARFVVEFQKDRHHSGAVPFEAKLQTDQHGGQIWTTRPLESTRTDQIIDLAELGMTVTDIAAEIGINKSNVSRTLKRAEEEGLYTPPRKRGKGAKVVDIKTGVRRDLDD